TFTSRVGRLIWLRLIGGWLLLALWMPNLAAQEMRDQELARLQQQLDRQAQEIANLRSAMDEPPASDEDVKALHERINRFEDTQRKSAQNDGPTLKMGGQLVVDYLWFSQDQQSRAAVGDVQDAVDFRRARLYGSGEAFEIYNYAIGFDFAQGIANNGRPAFIDNWFQINELPILGHLRIGHFFEPFSLERSSSNRNATFLERSLADTFAPSRNTGVAFYNQSENQTWYWSGGTFHDSDNFGDDAGDQAGASVDGRLCFRPYYDEPSNGRYFMHLGYAYSFRNANDGEIRYRSRPEAFGRSDEASIATPYFVDTHDLLGHNTQLHGFEFVWVHGPLSVQSELMAVPVDLIGRDNATFSGGYVYVSYFLTGENRRYNRDLAIMDRVQPFENFFRVRGEDGTINTGSGAWEVAARLSQIDLTNQSVQGGRLTDFTFGVNWYPTPYNRIKFNYILAHLDEVAAAPSNTSIFGVRFDWDF
ncbi:MAG TPA: porin, partial [Pirellulaceae bacterium]|nr:porin [Pirellulaceae bacterium]